MKQAAQSSAPEKQWQQFEAAVARFVAALDPNATVKHDIRLPDRDTGHPRQRDVWIEARVSGHFPVNVLVSCKRQTRKLNEQDMDAFVGELISSGAHKGVVYSSSGYTRPAIEKARARGICCCKLYENQPADIPGTLLFVGYCCMSSVRIGLLEPVDEVLGIETYADAFSLVVSGEMGDATVLDHLAILYEEGEKAAIDEAIASKRFPQPWTRAVEFSSQARDRRIALKVGVHGSWRVYRGRLEAHLLRGSYSFTGHEFRGSQLSPAIDMRGPSPGPGWELMEHPPEDLSPGMGMFVLYGGNFRDIATEHIGPKRVQVLG